MRPVRSGTERRTTALDGILDLAVQSSRGSVVKRPVRMPRTVLTLLPVAGVLVQIFGHLSTPGAGEIEIQVVLPDGAPVEDFLDALGVALEEPVRWNANVKDIRRQSLHGETALMGSKSYVLEVARALLTFYELRLVTLGPPHARVHVVTQDAHTCGLRAYD